MDWVVPFPFVWARLIIETINDNLPDGAGFGLWKELFLDEN
jgi:hypothetical protein